MLRPRIGLDWDDVTAPFNSIAIAMANEKYHPHPPLTLEEIDSWENRGRASVIREFYQDEELYRRQTVPEENKAAVRRLMEIADVYFITAVYPRWMGVRAAQILSAFPEFPQENMILGNAKNLIRFDIILDDAIHNVLESPADYPVLLRKPWNWKMTGLLSVTSLPEFVTLVEHLIARRQAGKVKIENPSVLALVGPSGSGKTQIAEALCRNESFKRPLTWSTKKCDNHRYIAQEDFDRGDFFEKTRYAGQWYGTRKDDIEGVLAGGAYCVMPLDLCGAIAMKRHFPTAIFFIDRDKEALIQDIIRSDYGLEEKTLRILSLDAEKRNRPVCDFVIDNRDDQGMRRIVDLL